MSTDLLSSELNPKQFRWISEQLYQICGIKLQPGKEILVRSRLSKRLRLLSLDGFEDYLSFLREDKSGKELAMMVDMLTTNKTSFFRESQHFDYLRQHLLPKLRASHQPIRLWSAGCSSGEEPYTLGIILREELSDGYDARILATDISSEMLSKARNAIYGEETLADLPPSLLRKYFSILSPNSSKTYRVNSDVRALVHLARLNLMEPWPMKGPFNAIFCRNVMIYFDKPTQERLVNRYAQLLAPGGLLFVGHSESLTSISHSLRYIQPAVYMK